MNTTRVPPCDVQDALIILLLIPYIAGFVLLTLYLIQRSIDCAQNFMKDVGDLKVNQSNILRQLQQLKKE